MRRLIMVCTLLAASLPVFGQSTEPEIRGRDFDHTTTDPTVLARALCAPFRAERDKALAIYSWLAHHITYDLALAQTNRSERIMYRTLEELARERERRRRARLQSTLRTRRGVCEHYAGLFAAMSKAVGLHAGEITGYVIRHPHEMGRAPLRSNHAWNWVEWDGEKHLLDVTYAAGAMDAAKQEFRQQYDPYWFDVQPTVLVQTHFPDSSTHQLLEHPLSAEAFSAQPFFFLSSAQYPILDWSPRRGFLRKQEAEKLSLVFLRKPKTILVGRDGLLHEVPLTWQGNRVEVAVPEFLRREKGILQIGLIDDEDRVRSWVAWQIVR